MLNSPYQKPHITPPASHPRVMVRQGDIERLRRNLALDECKLARDVWQELIKK